MSYVGPRPDSQIYAQPAIDYFSGNGSTTSFTLSRPVVSTAQMIVSVANVIQNPGSAFTVNGTTLQFTGTPPAGTNNIWVQYTTPITQINQPGQGTVGTTQMMDAAVTAAKIADTTITPSKLTVGAISWDSSGRVTMPYQPSFRAYSNDTTTVGNVIKYGGVVHNTGNHYNASTYTFTAPVSGLYYFEAHYLTSRTTVTGDNGFDFIHNGSAAKRTYGPKDGGANNHCESRGTLVIKLQAGDTMKISCYSSPAGDVLSNNFHCQFSGYLLS